MPDQPQTVRLTDLDSFSKDFVIARPFRFRLEEDPSREYEVMIRPLTEAQLAEAFAFSQIAPPKVKKKDESGAEVLTDEDDWADPVFQAELTNKSAQRIAFVFELALPDLKLEGNNIAAKAELIQKKFPRPYAAAIEAEIFRRSRNELAIVNLANFSASADSAQS